MLTRIATEMKAKLVLAERFERTAPTQWTVRLRPDVHYSDGSPRTLVAAAREGEHP